MNFLHHRDNVASGHLQDFVSLCRRILFQAPFFTQEGVAVEVLINPAAGALRKGGLYRKMMRSLEKTAQKRGENPPALDDLPLRFHETASPEHTGEKAVAAARELMNRPSSKKVLILAGGDGFHNNVGNALMRETPDFFKDVILFRLPMGTGNDSADAPAAAQAFERLLSPGGTKKDSLIQVCTARGEVYYAFNACSFGIDAYISELTNRLKKFGPAQAYKFFADVAVFHYEKRFPLQPWRIQIQGPQGGVVREGPFLLTIFGRRGNTHYGGGMQVLPGEENFLLADPVGLIQKIKLKPLFYRGDHYGRPGFEFFKTDEITLDYPGSILMQVDGEVIPLQREDFPLSLRRIPDAFSVFA